MNQIRKLIASLSLSQRILSLTAAIAIAAAILALVHWRKESDFQPLFTNLSSEDAGAVIQKLREFGSEYRLDQGGSTVLAPSSRIAELRLDLASAGLPKTGRIGFELFDKNNFGATEFTERINYRRALEGELERSIMTLTEVESARVHVTFPRDSVFLESQQPGKASIVLRLRPSAHLSKQNVAAIANLAASAVEGLSPDAVSIIDAQGNLLGRPRTQNASDETPSPDANFDYKQKVEADLLAKVNATLEPLLGPGKFHSSVTADCDFTRSDQSEENLDPTKSVMLTSMKTEETGGTSPASGVPGTASNLPRPAPRSGSSSGGVTHRTENITYQTSRTVKHTVLPPGVIKRLSVSVLLDQQLRWQGEGAKARRVIDAPSPEKIKSIRDVLSGVVGLSSDRGDQLLVETLPFDATLNSEPPPPPAQAPPPSNLPTWLQPYANSPRTLMIGAGIGASLLIVVIAFGSLLFARKKKPKPVDAAAPYTLSHPVNAAATPHIPEGTEGVAVVQRQMEERIAEQAALQQQADEVALNSLKLPAVATQKSEILVKHLRENIVKDTAGSANILRSWLTEDGIT
jgi:flagellar M-ring protein FliF